MVTRLQDEIKQTKPFARPSDEALLSILRTATVLEHGSNAILQAPRNHHHAVQRASHSPRRGRAAGSVEVRSASA